MRKTDGLTTVLVKINERYHILKAVYNQRMKELFDILKKLNSNRNEENIKLAPFFQQKSYSCSEVLVQFQNWLDDIQGLEIVNGLEKKITDLRSHTKKESNTIEELQQLIKDCIKAQGNSILFESIEKDLKNQIQSLNKSFIYTNKQAEEIHLTLFSKRKLIDSLSEHL